MDLIELRGKLAGTQTIESVMDILQVSRKKAIYYLLRLRKQGYVKTSRLSNNRRVYNISIENKLGGKSYYDIINQYSPVKVAAPVIYQIYGPEPSLEAALIYALQTRSLRVILASLALFRKIANWAELYHRAKENHLERQVGALYDLARKIMRVRRMAKKFRSLALRSQEPKFKYIIPKLSSSDFKDIEKIWRVYLPFNRQDLEDYR